MRTTEQNKMDLKGGVREQKAHVRMREWGIRGAELRRGEGRALLVIT
jgi:hypothetical protein